jgi:malate dehydrogenase (oxaloacetate-decarboxylating)
MIDTVLKLRTEHRPGQLAKVAVAIAEEGALIGAVSTLQVNETTSVREITVETVDEAHTERVIARLGSVGGVEVLETRDRAFDAHRGGKLHSTSRVRVEDLTDLRSIYTPGVARVVEGIARDPAAAWEFTSIGNSVGIFTNGSRVLGLGDVGTLASMPVMEGKAVLYDRFAGISATPILVDVEDVDGFVETVVRVSRGFGGIHLEDIRAPDCYPIEEKLIERLRKPVMHDDQHGTATVTLAAIINACRLIGRDLKRSRLGQIGLGAAGSAIARLALAYGVGEVLVSDPTPAAVARVTEKGGIASDLKTILADADIVVATTGKQNLIAKDDVRPGQVIFALSNPYAEIAPADARAAGAAFAGDGRSINNALAYPGLFRGALQVRSRAITPEMLVAAAEAIASLADRGEVVPSPLNMEVHRAVARAAAEKATEQGLAGTARL